MPLFLVCGGDEFANIFKTTEVSNPSFAINNVGKPYRGALFWCYSESPNLGILKQN